MRKYYLVLKPVLAISIVVSFFNKFMFVIFDQYNTSGENRSKSAKLMIIYSLYNIWFCMMLSIEFDEIWCIARIIGSRSHRFKSILKV